MSNHVLAFVFPGQGSQAVGMLGKLAGESPVIRNTFDEASKVLGYDLWQLCQQGPVEELNATEKTQPAMLVAGMCHLAPVAGTQGRRARHRHGAQPG